MAAMPPVARSAAFAQVQWKGRLLLLVLNLIPLLHIAMTGLLAWCLPVSTPGRIALVVSFLYLAPPLAARLVLTLTGIHEGRIAVGTRPFFTWWALFQMQVLFSRLPWLEEFLRLVPGAYSLWLRLWGARIGRLTFWSPGTLITDRSFLRIGDDVVFGAGVRLNPHVLAEDKDGLIELKLGTVTVGDRVIVGGYSLLAAGSELAPDQVTRAFLLAPPFTVWREGKRVRGQHAIESE